MLTKVLPLSAMILDFFYRTISFFSSHNIFHTPADNGGDEQKIEGLPCRQQVGPVSLTDCLRNVDIGKYCYWKILILENIGPVSLTDCLENVDIGKYWPGFVDGLLLEILILVWFS